MSRRLYLTYSEVQHIYQATGGAKHHIRDRCMILMCLLHGFRTSELIGLKISDIDYLSGNIYIRRLKNGLSTTHPLHPKERELLQQWMAVRKTCANNESDWLFLTSAGHRLSRQRFYSLLRHYGEQANIPLKVHPHMLRLWVRTGRAGAGYPPHSGLSWTPQYPPYSTLHSVQCRPVRQCLAGLTYPCPATKAGDPFFWLVTPKPVCTHPNHANEKLSCHLFWSYHTSL